MFFGNKAYTAPIEEGHEIVEQAKARFAGLAKSVRLTKSHATGKIEVIGKLADFVYFKYHRAAARRVRCRNWDRVFSRTSWHPDALVEQNDVDKRYHLC